MTKDPMTSVKVDHVLVEDIGINVRPKTPSQKLFLKRQIIVK